MNKLVSVIVPVYNIAPYIGRCLDSLVKQIYSPIEIIAVDDGSSDGSGEILDRYAGKYENIIVIHKENGGVSSARNAGLKVAKGDYIGFTDGDDLVEPDMYEMLVRNLEENNVDISHCGYQMVFSYKIDYYHNTKIRAKMSSYEGIKELLSGELIEPGLWNKLYRKKLFNNLEVPEDIRINEDLLANFRLFKNAENSFFEDSPKYHYMMRKDSATTSVIKPYKLWDPVKVCKTIMQEVQGEDELYTLIYNRYIRNLINIINGAHGLKEESKKAKKELKCQVRDRGFYKYASKKINLMAIGTVYFHPVYKLIRKLYDLVTGIDHKYDLE